MTDRHADFEALSAYVDGEAPEWADHVEACAPCRATAAELRALAVVVAAPVAARSPADIDRDIAAALAAVPTSTSAASAPAPRPARPAPSRRSGNPWALGAVAAVVLAVLGISGVVLSSYRESDNSTTVAGPAFQSEANLDARTGPEAGGGVAGAAPSLPPADLGDVGDAATLRSRAQPGLAPGPASAGSTITGSSGGSAGAATGNSATSDGRSSSSANSGAASNATAGAVSGATGSAVAGSGLTPTTTLNQGAGATVVGTRPCEEQARTREPTLGPVVYFATARQGAVAGFVLGFGPAPGSAPAPVTLLLLAQEGCAEVLRSVGP